MKTDWIFIEPFINSFCPMGIDQQNRRGSLIGIVLATLQEYVKGVFFEVVCCDESAGVFMQFALYMVREREVRKVQLWHVGVTLDTMAEP